MQKFIRRSCLQRNKYNVNFKTMNSIFRKTMGLIVAVSALNCSSADARRHCSRHRCCYPQRIVTVATRPAMTIRISNRFDRKERLRMALSYLNGNQYLSILKYAKMTGQSIDMAEAELDAFACDGKIPITVVIANKKRLYTKR